MDLVLVARFVVAASAVSLLVVGLGVLAWEAARRRSAPLVRDRGPLALVNYVGILGFVGVGLWSAITSAGCLPPSDQPLDGLARVVGVMLVWAAGLLAIWGLWSIGGQMSSEAEVRAETELVTSGAFAVVRHPLYLSTLLLWAGSAIALLSWLMAVCTIVLVPVFVARSRLEEQILVDHFGDAYRRYAARVPMLLPVPRGAGSAGDKPSAQR